MEERTQASLNTIRVVITGPECTGKSTLAAQLADFYNTNYVPEYAREYIESLGRPYTYKDVIHIAETQVKQSKDFDKSRRIIFLDTYLIITKVWFEVLYGHYPLWIDNELGSKNIDLFLLCDTSIPWVADSVRENGGVMREELYQKYKAELERLGYRYKEIKGLGRQRLIQSIEAINQFFPDICR